MNKQPLFREQGKQGKKGFYCIRFISAKHGKPYASDYVFETEEAQADFLKEYGTATFTEHWRMEPFFGEPTYTPGAGARDFRRVPSGWRED